MESVDLIKFPASNNSVYGNEIDGPCASDAEAMEADSLHLNSELKYEINGEIPGTIPDDACESGFEAIESDSLPLNSEVIDEINGTPPGTISDGLQENAEASMTTEIEQNVDNNTPPVAVDFELTESDAVVDELIPISSVNSENGNPAVQSESILSNHRTNGILLSSRETATVPLSGVKRPQIAVDEEQPSVHVVYKSLTRESKRKLEELLQQWSLWHTQSCSSSNDSKVVLESGAETYFPALHIGLDKQSAVTFCVDNPTEVQSSKEFTQLDDASVPLYDRGYSFALTLGGESSSLEGGVEKIDTSRCFNCSSYSHALKDCPKPRDNAAVSNARKQHNSRRNQHANSRTSTRYYQSSRVGKYDGLTPGVLDPETRQLLGLGELDPPPWLRRMREIGYPPGYFEEDEEDQPSGITIFGDEAYTDEGEIHNGSYSKPSKKQSVEFPGINAPIPENADEWLWTAGSSSFNPSSDRTHKRQKVIEIKNVSTGHSNELRWSIEMKDERPRHSNSFENLTRQYNGPPMWSKMELDERPPGCDPWTSSSLSKHIQRYGGYDSTHNSPQSSSAPIPIPWSHNLARSMSAGVRRSPLAYDEPPPPPRYDRYGSFPY